LLITFLVTVVVQTPSSAGEVTRWATAKTVTSGSWSVIAIGANQIPSNAPYAITWSVNTGTAYNFFTLRNSGGYSVSGFTVDITQTQLGGSGKPNNTTFELCQNGIWNIKTNTCSGSRVTVGTAVDLLSTIIFSGLNLITGAELSMRASTPPNIKNIYTMTLSVNLPRTQIRSGVVTNT